MKENKYYTPNIEDIRIGYECEIYEIEIEDEFIFKIPPKQEWVKTVMKKPAHLSWCSEYIRKNEIRTPYLTEEQIEAEGWFKLKSDEFSKKSKDIYNVDQEFEMKINFEKFIIEIGYDCGNFSNCVVFEGKCPSINEFRYICKLLGI